MVRKLGPLILLALMGSHALAQDRPTATVRLFPGARLDPTTQLNTPWPANPPAVSAPSPRPEPASAASPVELLLSLVEAF